MPRELLRQVRQSVAVLGLTVLYGCNVNQILGPTPSPPEQPENKGPKPNVAGVWLGDVTVMDCWRIHGDGPDPCDNRRGRLEPVNLNISHIGSQPQTPDADLRVVLEALVPKARGICYGTRDSRSIFFQGLITRPADQFDAYVTFVGHLDGDRMQSVYENVEVNVTLRTSAGWQLLLEQWRFSAILRQ
jgi:hypothetical protein